MSGIQLTIRIPGRGSVRASILKNVGINPYAFPGIVVDPPKEPTFDGFPLSNDERFEIIKSLLPKYHGKTFDQLNIKTHKREFSEPRQHLMWLLDKFTTFNLREIGEFLHRGIKKYGAPIPMDHATVIHGVKSWSDIIKTQKKKAAMNDLFVNELKELIK